MVDLLQVLSAIHIPPSSALSFKRSLSRLDHPYSRHVNDLGTANPVSRILRRKPVAKPVLITIPTTPSQTQNITSTEGAGNGTSPETGFIPNSPITDGGINCTNLLTGRDNKCWDQLNLTDWVENWLFTHWCHENEGFASCFLREEGFPGLDCTGIRPGSCIAPTSQDLLDKPHLFYVVYNIFCMFQSSTGQEHIRLIVAAINQFFSSWWSAVEASSSIAANNVDEIVQLLDPPSSTNLIFDDVMIALTGLFAILPPAIGFGIDRLEESLENAVKAAAAKGITSSNQLITDASIDGLKLANGILYNAVFVAPQIARFLFPIDSEKSQVIQMADLHTDLAQIILRVQNNLNDTVTEVMKNSTMFLAFASQGNFTNGTPTLPQQTNYLLYGFNTYIISQAMKGNNIYATMAVDTNPQALATNGTTLNYPIDCQAYNEQNVCQGESWWYSGTYSSAFGLDDFSHMDREYGDVMTQLLANYTTGELLFENAYACNMNGNYGQPINVTVNAGGVNTACLSQLQVLQWDMGCTDPHPVVECEFLQPDANNKTRQNTFLEDCGSHSAFSTMDETTYCVPEGYLGPLLTQNKYKLKRDRSSIS